jgi:hypothetical protein
VEASAAAESAAAVEEDKAPLEKSVPSAKKPKVAAASVVVADQSVPDPHRSNVRVSSATNPVHIESLSVILLQG